LVTLLRLEFLVLVLYLSVYFYLCGFNYSLFFVVYFLIFSVCDTVYQDPRHTAMLQRIAYHFKCLLPLSTVCRGC
jgi:hypothetical protein